MQIREGFDRPISNLFLTCVSLLFCLAIGPPKTQCQENPYIVTYDHYLEEPGNLEIEYFSTLGSQRAGNNFHAFWIEFEYGVTAWWTTELYLDGQTTFGDSTLFTGVRWENRFRPLKYEHFINPIIYVEYEHKSAADKILKEVEGHDVESDFAVSNAFCAKNAVTKLKRNSFSPAPTKAGTSAKIRWRLRICRTLPGNLATP